MRCCASPTTSTARPAIAQRMESTGNARVAFGALLASMALRPLAKPLGFYGEFVVDACALAMARTMPTSALPRIGAP